MARYFFHLTNGDVIADDVGEEFDLVKEARGRALAVARELLRNAPPHGFGGYHISVVDERGLVVFTALLRAVVVLAVLLLSGIEVFS
jgi:hypothetical protein